MQEPEPSSIKGKIILITILALVIMTGIASAKYEFGNKTVQEHYFVPTVSAKFSNSHGGIGGGDVKLSKHNTLFVSGIPSNTTSSCNQPYTNKVRVHEVEAGETISQIAELYCVSEKTIAWQNEIHKTSHIEEGQQIIILPINGTSHTVTSGDTIDLIAEKYGGSKDEIIVFNDLTPSQKLEIGTVVIVPNGEVEGFYIDDSHGHSHSHGSLAGVRGLTNINFDSYFARPIRGGQVTQGLHGYNAIDFGAKRGTPILSAAGGKVLVTRNYGWNGGYGKYIVIDHPNGTQTLYAHLDTVNIRQGAYVDQGDIIGYIGNTGKVISLGGDGTHLHFEVRGAQNPFR